MRNPSSSSSATKTTPCCSKVGIKKGPWTPEEDELLSNYINREGEGRWRTLPKRAGLLRCGKSCRLRWMNYLRPSVKRGRIAPDEEDLILRLHRLLELEKETGGSYQGTGNFTNNLQDHYQNDHLQVVDNGGGGFMMGLLPSNNHGHSNQEDNNYYIGNCTEDTFSSFLDSLINDHNVFMNNHHQQQQPQSQLPPVLLATEPGGMVGTSGQTFSHGGVWEAEMVSTMAAALGDEQNALDNHHPA
ncbi:hypothetical protein JRO89_XS04G0120000 [Xanthoceras sorbifolium]|uniref:Uncharacterized protein n=1 Tax=Xanthoceras sorbifolium TaxID=99658 RepID=A0ABQ8I517_9ROSI|nr:hypothetical protein JRO89_XS04G0120000 [Xanthoceras sorbifolium]